MITVEEERLKQGRTTNYSSVKQTVLPCKAVSTNSHITDTAGLEVATRFLHSAQRSHVDAECHRLVIPGRMRSSVDLRKMLSLAEDT